MPTQETIVINEGLEERQRTTSSGTKSRFTVSITSEPIFHDFDTLKLGAKPAAAIRDAVIAGIKAISQIASPATLLKRKYARAAFDRGAAWAVRRYAGGRTGVTTPGVTDTLYNDSERLANGIAVRQNVTEESWTINVPANRLDPTTFGDRGRFVAMVDRLRDLVPAMSNPFDVPEVVNAIQAGINGILMQKLAATDKSGDELQSQILELASGALQDADDQLSE